MKVSIISINFNNEILTCELIESILGTNYSGEVEIIVVDNKSTKGNPDIIKAIYPNVILVKSLRNLGFAGGNNLGLKYATGDYVLFANNDTVIPKDAIGVLVDVLEKDKSLGGVSPKIRYYDRPDLIQYAGGGYLNKLKISTIHRGKGEVDKGQYDEGVSETTYLHGAGMMIRREVLLDVGAMDESYFLYYEELDWSLRIKEKGYKLAYCSDTIIFHKESASTGKNSPLKVYFMNRNRILFARKNFTTLWFFISSIYILSVSMPVNILRFMFQGRDLVEAYLRAMRWNLDHLFIPIRKI